ncbi:stalk domain-containing protein [Paenibacillus turicensis]|uniref:stalk domain-containing protein n=1 Tax=Paenibacillus turicensis TaxID=160487 RepID=UPI003D28898F
MMKRKTSKTLLMTAVLILSLTFSGLTSAAGMKTMKKNGMELLNLRQTSEMYGYSVQWNSKERSVTLVYKGKMDGMMKDDNMSMKDDTMMKDDMGKKGDMMMKDDMDKKDDMMMKDDMDKKDDKMMKDDMKPTGQNIKLWIGSKKVVINGKQIKLDTAPTISKGSTYVTIKLVNQYMKPTASMK